MALSLLHIDVGSVTFNALRLSSVGRSLSKTTTKKPITTATTMKITYEIYILCAALKGHRIEVDYK